MLNKICQIAFRCAYRLALCYWFIVRPRSTGVVVAVWCQDRVLLVKNSYQPLQTFPGGGIKRNEDVRTAAARELREEVGITVEPNQLHLVGKIESDDRYLKNTSTIFEFFFKELPEIKIDSTQKLVEIMVSNNMVSSNGEAKRMIKQGAVKINDEKVVDMHMEISSGETIILKVGKRKFLKII